jgi:hypothetical protein
MTTFRKTVTATLAALTLATTVIASGAEARPRWGYGYGHRGWGVGAGVVGALAAGAIIAGATRPAYGYYAAPVRSCDMVERFDRWGNVIGYRRVCGYY